MAINFPNNPVNGDTHVVDNITYTYDSAKGKWDISDQSVVYGNLADIRQSIIPRLDGQYDLGSSGRRWKDLYLSGTSIDLGGLILTNNNGTLNVDGAAVGSGGGGSSTPAINGDGTVNEPPMVLTEPSSTHALNNDGSTSTVTMLAEDPDGGSITYGIAYKNSGNTRPTQLAADTTVDANGVYTFTPSSTSTDAGTFTARLSATDGTSVITRFVDFSLDFLVSMFEPAGTTLLLGVSFDNSNTSVTGTYTVTPQGTLTFSSDGSGVAETEYATGWNNNINYLQINDLSAADSGQNKTFIAWYKGTQTSVSTPTNYSPGVPIFGDSRTSVWTGFGIDGGVIYAAGSGTAYTGTTTVTDNNWHMLAWTYSSSNLVNAFVDGTQEITGADVSGGVGNNRVDQIGSGYAYTGVTAPTALDNIQIFDGILTQSQIQEIYNKGI